MGKEDDLLARELGKVGASGGKLGGRILGNSIAGGVGGFFGASLAARFLPTERYQLELKLCADPQMVLAKVYAFISSNGRVTDSEELGESPYPTVSSVVGSGFFNMNPTIVHAEIVGIDGETCSVVLTGAAKEGLIKQRAAEKAVNRLAETLKLLLTAACARTARSIARPALCFLPPVMRSILVPRPLGTTCVRLSTLRLDKVHREKLALSVAECAIARTPMDHI